MKKNPLKNIPFLLTVLLLTMTIASAGNAAAVTQMPDFSLKSVGENTTNINSKSLEGQVLLITFWATWCPPCIQEIPSLIKLQDEFSEKGFSVLGVSVDQGSTRSVKKIMDKTGINYPVAMADSKITRDFGGIVGIPTSFLINSKGHVIKSYPGYVAHSILEDEIKKLLP